MAEDPPADCEAVRRLQRGDEQALIALYDKYEDRLFRFAVRLLGQAEEAEEVVAETFLQAFRHARSYRGTGSFSGWLFRIARNLSFERLRTGRRLATIPLEDLPDEGREFASFDPANGVTLAALVRQALQGLPSDYRLVLTMRELDGLTNAETAQALGRSPAAAKSLHFRARQALRDAVVQALRQED